MRFRETAAASRLRLAVAAGFFGFALAACGGGGSGGNDNGGNDIGGSPGGWNTTPAPGPEEPSSPAPGPGLPEPESPQPPAPEPGLVPQPEPSPEPSTPTVAIEGTAASGAALAGAAIDLKCAGTTRHGNADGAGRYRLDDVRADALPCLLRASYAQTVYVAPVASQGAGVITVNATPLTHLLASRMLGQPADLAFANAGASTFGRINPAAISAAQGQVHAQLGRLGYLDLPADWIGTSFQARAGDPYDGALDALGIALGNQGLTVPLAAGQLASAEPMLQLAPPSPPAQACAPRLIDGFSGSDRTRWTTVSSDGQQFDAIGIGGGPGFARNALVEVTFADGTRLAGARTDAVKGMVTLATCPDTGSRLPALVHLQGDSQSAYYDVGRGQWTSFSGHGYHAIVTRLGKDVNLAVTPLTEAAYRRTLALWGEAGGQYGSPAAWQEPGRVQRAHDEVLTAVNDQIPGMYRLERLDRMPWLLDEHGNVEDSYALPRNPSGIHGIVLAAFARAAAQARSDDLAPMVTLGERLAADLADGVLDNPHAGLDSSISSYTEPPYTVSSLWDQMSKATIDIGRKVGVPALWDGKPFPLGLFIPKTRGSKVWPEQYIGLYSDGVLRVAFRCSTRACSDQYHPTRRVRAFPSGEWLVFDVAQMDAFDPETMTGVLRGGMLVRVTPVSDGDTIDNVVTYTDYDAMSGRYREVYESDVYRGDEGRVSLRVLGGTLEEITQARWLQDISGLAYYATSAFCDQVPNGQEPIINVFGVDHVGLLHHVRAQVSVDPYTRQVGSKYSVRKFINLPANVRQLSSDGRLVYALLRNGDVYLLNPELLVSEQGSFVRSSYCRSPAGLIYEDLFRRTSYAETTPVLIRGAGDICRIGGTYLQGCDGRIFLINREYFWISTPATGITTEVTAVRAPGQLFNIQVVDDIDARGWRPFKAPMRQDVTGNGRLRLLSKTDGSYVLRSDTWHVWHGTALVHGSDIHDGLEITQATVESWLGY